ncbi:hypothetical protein ABPG74_009968 [Tetrahymena malaccensis]
MNKVAITLAIIIGVCAASNIKCTQEQKEAVACTYEYEPVCGVKANSSSKYSQSFATYGNKCQACSEEGVEFYAHGECDKYPSNALFCHPDSYLQPACTKELDPVCGYYDEDSLQYKNQKFSEDFSNKCNACFHKNISYILQGFCQ